MPAFPPALFPDCVRTCVSDGADLPDDLTLFPEEAPAVAQAVETRRREFAAGRWCARRALAALGVESVAIPVAARRAPVWPAGVVGSISHCRGFVGAAVAPVTCLSALGFDVELAEPLAPELVASICTDVEQAWMARDPRAPGCGWPKLLFSAKESVHKCIFPTFGRTLDFVDVTIVVDPAHGTFAVRSARPEATAGAPLESIHGRWAATGPFVMTSAVILAASARTR